MPSTPTPVAAAARAAVYERLYAERRDPRDLLEAARHRHLAGYAALAATLVDALLDTPGTPADIAVAARTLHPLALADLAHTRRDRNDR